MSINITIPAKEMLERQIQRKWTKKSVSFFVNLLERFFGSNLLIKVPKNIQNLDSSLFRALVAARKVRDRGYFDKLVKVPLYPDEPFIHRYVIYPATQNHTVGANFFDEEKAIWSVIAEEVERSIWRDSNAHFRTSLIQSTWKNIFEKSIDLSRLAGFSEIQKKQNDILRYDENTSFGWIKVTSLVSKRKKYCPAQLMSPRYFRENVKTLGNSNSDREPMLRWPVTTGLATGQSLEEALVKGILETIERDAFMISYLNKLSPPLVDLNNLSEQDPQIRKVLKGFGRYRLESYAVQLVTDFPVNVILGILIDRSGNSPAVTVGARAHFDLKTCVLDAFSEALSSRCYLRSVFNQPIDLTHIGRTERMIYWTKKENLHKIEFLIKGPKKIVNLSSQKNAFFDSDKEIERRNYYKIKLTKLVSDLSKKKYEACFVNLTDSKISSIGFKSVFVIIPELQPMHLSESMPYLGGLRLSDIPKKLGYLLPEELNKIPHPFP
jgi:ribosomal protein S12 methylthiotransferase accessory factor